MGIVIRQSFKSSIVQYAAVVIGIANRLFLLPQYLTLEQLGLVDLLFTLGVLLSKLGFLGIHGTITKFFEYYKKENRLDYFSGFFILIPVLGYTFFSVLFLLFKNQIIAFFPNNIELLSKFYLALFPIGFAILFREIFTAYSRNNLRLTVPAIFNELLIRIGITILLIAIGLKFINFDQYIIQYTALQLIISFALMLYCLKSLNLRIRFNIKAMSNIELKRIFTFAFFILLAGLSGIASQYTDSVMLASMKGLHFSGIYSIAFYIGAAIELPRRSITSISSALIAKHWENNETNKIKILYTKTSITQGIIGFFLFLLVLVSLEDIYGLLPKSNELEIGKYVVIVIGLSKVIDMITGVNNEILRLSKYYKYDFILVLFFILLSIALNYYLIPTFGLMGAAYATLIAVFVYNMVRFIILYILFRFNPFDRKTLYLILIFIGHALVFYLLPKSTNSSLTQIIFAISIKSLLFGFSFMCMVYLLKLSSDLNNLLSSLFKKAKTIF